MLGIDYGNTNCSVAVMRSAGIEVIANEQGLRLTPAVVERGQARRGGGRSGPSLLCGGKKEEKKRRLPLTAHSETRTPACRFRVCGHNP